VIGELLAFAAAGLATGLLFGTLGVGGGFILVPLLTVIGVPIHEAVGTSLAFVVLVAGAGAARHVRQSSADAPLAAAIALPGAVTAQLGAHVASNCEHVFVTHRVWAPRAGAPGRMADLHRASHRRPCVPTRRVPPSPGGGRGTLSAERAQRWGVP
jgi:hypothetical protein